MRLFFGIPIDDNAQNKVNNVISVLKNEYKGKYTLANNLHITLTFIGEVEEKVSYMLSDIGDLAFSGIESFATETGDIGSFKDGNITYLSIEKSKRLDSIYNSLNTLLDEAGMVYTKNDVFTPHITLRRGTKLMLDREVAPIDIEVDRICLFESKRVDDILRYIPIKTWKLKR